jgi:hypothetical protein
MATESEGSACLDSESHDEVDFECSCENHQFKFAGSASLDECHDQAFESENRCPTGHDHSSGCGLIRAASRFGVAQFKQNAVDSTSDLLRVDATISPAAASAAVVRDDRLQFAGSPLYLAFCAFRN